MPRGGPYLLLHARIKGLEDGLCRAAPWCCVAVTTPAVRPHHHPLAPSAHTQRNSAHAPLVLLLCNATAARSTLNPCALRCAVLPAQAKMGERDSREEILKAFRLFDDDSSGTITFRDLKRVAKELGENLTGGCGFTHTRWVRDKGDWRVSHTQVGWPKSRGRTSRQGKGKGRREMPECGLSHTGRGGDAVG